MTGESDYWARDKITASLRTWSERILSLRFNQSETITHNSTTAGANVAARSKKLIFSMLNFLLLYDTFHNMVGGGQNANYKHFKGPMWVLSKCRSTGYPSVTF